MNRFNRSSTAPAEQQNKDHDQHVHDHHAHQKQATGQKHGDSNHGHENKPENKSSDVDIENLKQRLARAQERKMRRELELEQTKKELEECAQNAKNLFGVESLDELEEFVLRAEEEDKLNMEAFIAQLLEEEERLNVIEQRLKDLDNNA